MRLLLPPCTAMPETWPLLQLLGGAGRATSVTPVQSPVLVPHCPGVALCGLSVPMARTQPSVHHGWPLASTPSMWGVRPPGSCERMRYSEIRSLLAVSRLPMRATLLLFSVNHTRLPLAAMPYGLLLALGVVKSVEVCELGSNSPTAETR